VLKQNLKQQRSAVTIVILNALLLSACGEGASVSDGRTGALSSIQGGAGSAGTELLGPTDNSSLLVEPIINVPANTGSNGSVTVTTGPVGNGPVVPNPSVTEPVVTNPGGAGTAGAGTGGAGSGGTNPQVAGPSAQQSGINDDDLRQLAFDAGVTGNIEAGRNLPAITDPVAQLGKDLFFTRGLGGNLEVACVSCHHPNLGGGDQLSLSVGVGAVDPTVLGPGRVHSESGGPNVPRNAPTVFNMGFWDELVFWDGRIENMGADAPNNGASDDIRTPDVGFGRRDPSAGQNLTVAQAHFPVTSAAEMRSDSFMPGADSESLRARLAARIGDYGDGAGEMGANTWLQEFRNAFNDRTATAEELITYDNIAFAIGEYERSMVFTNNAFNRWVLGDNSALSAQQKRGAELFYTRVDQGGAGCLMCHDGDFFTGETVENTGMIQIGEGKGDGVDDDFGRERESLRFIDRYKFRTPSLLNVAVTGPYGHAGAYDTLEQVVSHYSDPVAAINDWFDRGGVCGVEQFRSMPNCASLYPNARANADLALQQVQFNRDSGSRLFLNANLSNQQQSDLVSFLQALTDPCVQDPACMSPWTKKSRTCINKKNNIR